MTKTTTSAQGLSSTYFRNRVWLFLVCVLPSVGTVLKYGKVQGTVLYLLFAALWTALLLPWIARRAAGSRQAEKTVLLLAVVTLLLLTASLLVLYPLSHSGRLGKGSDRADALNISIPRLFKGENPYTVRTFLGNPVTPLPGALVLGSPFRAIFRDVAYQNIFWVFVLFLLLCTVTETRIEAFLLWSTFIFLCPALLADVMTGGDFTVNAIYCAAATLWLLQGLTRRPQSRDRWRLPLLAAFWGLCLCSRPSYLILVPLVFTYALQRQKWRAVSTVGLALSVYAALVLPIYLSAPQDFSPLHVGAKMTIVGHATPLLLGSGIGLAVILGLVAWKGKQQELWFPFAAGSIFLVLPVPPVLLADSQRAGHLDLTSLLFLLSPSVLALLAVPLRMAHKEKQAQETLVVF